MLPTSRTNSRAQLDDPRRHVRATTASASSASRRRPRPTRWAADGAVPRDGGERRLGPPAHAVGLRRQRRVVAGRGGVFAEDPSISASVRSAGRPSKTSRPRAARGPGRRTGGRSPRGAAWRSR